MPSTPIPPSSSIELVICSLSLGSPMSWYNFITYATLTWTYQNAFSPLLLCLHTCMCAGAHVCMSMFSCCSSSAIHLDLSWLPFIYVGQPTLGIHLSAFAEWGIIISYQPKLNLPWALDTKLRLLCLYSTQLAIWVISLVLVRTFGTT